MTNSEFSDTFSTLLNSYNSQAQFGEQSSNREIVLDEYEKSLFLTKAQEEIVLGLYNGSSAFGDAFEETEEVKRYLSNLVREASLKPITTSNGAPLGLSSTSKFFTLPSDLWFITYESVIVSNSKCDNMSSLNVYPIRQDEYHSVKNNPFRGANDRRALRLDLSEGNVEIVCKYLIDTYYIRYIMKVPPIILEDLPNELTINNNNKATECVLHEALHQKILDIAVRMALQSKGYNLTREK